MDIRNVTEFKNYVMANKLASLSRDIESVVICLTDYERGCSCWKAGDRQKIYDNCRALYIRTAQMIERQLGQQFAAAAGGSIRFSEGGIVIARVGC